MTNEELVTQIKAGEDVPGNMARLFEQTRSFIHSMAWRYRGYAELDDLQQEGYLALYDAVSGYNPAAGCLFLTYARYWIRQRMIHFVQTNSIVRIPGHEWKRLQEYKKVVATFRKCTGRKPSRREIAHEMRLSYKQLIELEKAARMAQIGSLDRVLSEDGEETVGDLVTGEADVEGEATAATEQELLQRTLWPLVDALPGRQPAVVRARYQEGKSLKETGQRIGVSPEMVRQIEKKALRELRKPSRSRALRPFLPEEMEGQAYRHNGVGEFSRTWTSSTEWVAMRL